MQIRLNAILHSHVYLRVIGEIAINNIFFLCILILNILLSTNENKQTNKNYIYLSLVSMCTPPPQKKRRRKIFFFYYFFFKYNKHVFPDGSMAVILFPHRGGGGGGGGGSPKQEENNIEEKNIAQPKKRSYFGPHLTFHLLLFCSSHFSSFVTVYLFFKCRFAA